jgi:hypothetical protein
MIVHMKIHTCIYIHTYKNTNKSLYLPCKLFICLITRLYNISKPHMFTVKLYIRACVYIYTCMCLYIYVHVFIYIRACVYIYTCMCLYKYVHLFIYIYICIYRYIRTYIYICSFEYMYTYIYIHICLHIYLCTCQRKTSPHHFLYSDLIQENPREISNL